MKISLVGPYPPPYGGISVYIQRLKSQLTLHDIDVTIAKNNTVKRWIFVERGKWWQFDVVHFHDIDWFNRFLIGMLGLLGVKTVLTIHGDSLQDQLDTLRPGPRFLLKSALRHIKHIIVVKPEVRDMLATLGVVEARISVIPAYLPPLEETADEGDIPDEVSDFLTSHEPIIVANGYRVVPLGPQDIYGVEMTIEMCSVIIKDYPHLGFLFYLADIGDQATYQQLLSRIKGKQLEQNYRFVIGQKFIPVLPKSDIFLRPTYRDGYGVSVAEALYYGVPAIASDVCQRAPGAIIFETGNIDDLIIVVRDVLKDLPQARKQASNFRPASTLDQLLHVYQHVMRTE